VTRSLVAAIVFGGCTVSASIGRTPMGQGQNQAWVEVAVGPRKTNKVDLLFMIDNSPSMAPKQAELRNRFPDLVNTLQTAGTKPAHYHIGVVTSDLGAGPDLLGGGQCRPDGDSGKLQAIGRAAPLDCQPFTDGTSFIDFDQVTGANNLPMGQDLARTFDCMASVGDIGCGFEMPLESVYRALHDPPAENAGFLRDDALLVVFFLTDEDDCSAPPDTDLFDPSKTDYGALTSYRCTRFGITCGTPPNLPPYGDSHGALQNCTASPSPPGKLYPIDRYTKFFKRPKALGGVKDDPADVFLVAIDAPEQPFSVVVGDPQVEGFYPPCAPDSMIDGRTCAVLLQRSCVSSADNGFSGDPAVRLNEVVGSSLPRLGGAICDTTYQSTMIGLARTLVSTQVGDGCIPGVVPDALDPRCNVSDETQLPDGTSVQTTIDSCVASGGALPCWTVAPSDLCAPQVDPRDPTKTEQLQLTIMRDPSSSPPATVTRAQCVVVTEPS
jgi:hypothetical protein